MVKIFRSSYQFSGNVYVVHSEKGTILIDLGYYDSRIKKYLMVIGNLDAILLTHGHWDHIYGLDSLKADFPDTPLYPGHGNVTTYEYVLNHNQAVKKP